MPLGSAVKSTIDIDFTRAQGVNSSGRITFQPPRTRVGTTMVSSHGVQVDIVSGVGSINLVRLPLGTYHVIEEIDGKPRYEFDFSLPLGSADLIQYEEIAHVAPLPTVYTYVKTVNGESPNPVTGNIDVVGGGTPPDATDSVKGVLRLTGDLGGTASTPTLSSARIAEIAGKYNKPTLGIPSTDLTAAIQTALGLGITAVQPEDLDEISAEIATKYVKPPLGIPITDLVSAAQSGISLGSTAIQQAQLDAAIDALVIPDSPDDIGAQPIGDYATNTTTNALDDRLDAVESSILVCPYLASEYGMYSATGPDAFQFMSASGWGNDDHNISLLWVPAGKVITKVAVAVRSQSAYSSTGTPAQAKVYDVNGTLLGSSEDDPSMWLNKGWSIQTLTTPIASQPNGRFVYVGISGGGFGGHSPAWPTGISGDWPEATSSGLLNGRRRAFYSSSSAGLPFSFNPASYGTTTSYVPLLGLIA